MSRTPSGAAVGGGWVGPAARSALARVGRRACLVAVVGVALLGALLSPPLTTLVLGPALGVFVAAQSGFVHPDFPARPAARRAVLMSGLGAALLVPFVMGAVALGAAGAILTLVLMLLGVLAIMGSACDPGRRDAAPGVEAALLRELVHGCPTSDLLDEWRSSAADLVAVDPERRAAAIALRAVLLEEMSCRDPDGVERWLRDDAGAPPDRHIRGDSGPRPA
jgi:hypothetical protein